MEKFKESQAGQDLVRNDEEIASIHAAEDMIVQRYECWLVMHSSVTPGRMLEVDILDRIQNLPVARRRRERVSSGSLAALTAGGQWYVHGINSMRHCMI